jgi:nucleoside-diphosphate-sugar epimerase
MDRSASEFLDVEWVARCARRLRRHWPHADVASLEEAATDPRVEIVDGSVTDVEQLQELMRDADYVFHLAALWLHECVHEPRSAIDVNVVGTWNVVEAAKETGVKRVVYSSSASVYGNALESPMTEEHPFNNRTLYGATKIAGEQFFRAFNEQHGLDYVGLRYMNIYGPRMDYKGTYVSVIMKVLDRIDAGERPVIFGDGSQAYDFVHVGDVARANILAMKSDATDVNLNVGTGVRTSIKELVVADFDGLGRADVARNEAQASALDWVVSRDGTGEFKLLRTAATNQALGGLPIGNYDATAGADVLVWNDLHLSLASGGRTLGAWSRQSMR